MGYVNRVLAFLAGVVLLVAGVVGAVEAVSTGLGNGFIWIPGHDWIRTLRTTDWSVTAAVVTFAFIAAGGVLLFIAEAWPRPQSTLELASDALPPGQQWVVHRRSLQARLAREVQDATPCDRLRAHLRYRRGTWRLTLTGRGPLSARDDVRSRAREVLQALGAPLPAVIRVRLHPASV
jgi:hypothetical protein